MQELLLIALVTPGITGLLSIFLTNVLCIQGLNVFGSFITSTVLFISVYKVSTEGIFSQGFIYVDALSAVLLMVVAVLTFTANIYSLSYMGKELKDGHISVKMLTRYYALLNIFVFTMISVLIVENLGLMWVAVEATTLASALLVAFYYNRSALEAAWKYVMVCTVGICMALLGTILLYYAQVTSLGTGSEALSWLALRQMAGHFNPTLAKLSFIFIVIGYGTKAGLAPMHTWLPDAHSQAPSPISGLLSGALLSCAVYALVRNIIVLAGSINADFMQVILMGLGILSIAIAVPFVLVQHDLKRLLAYSSVEHMGLIMLGFGLGTPMAVYGALLHIVNHALVKSALFYAAGVITQEYRTKHMVRIRGLFSTMPAVATLFMLSVLAITGTPPFNVFISKFTLISAVFHSGQMAVGIGILLLMAAIFAGMVYYCLNMSFKEKPAYIGQIQVGKPALFAMGLSMGLALITGLYIPVWLNHVLSQAVNIVTGGSYGI